MSATSRRVRWTTHAISRMRSRCGDEDMTVREMIRLATTAIQAGRIASRKPRFTIGWGHRTKSRKYHGTVRYAWPADESVCFVLRATTDEVARDPIWLVVSVLVPARPASVAA